MKKIFKICIVFFLLIICLAGCADPVNFNGEMIPDGVYKLISKSGRGPEIGETFEVRNSRFSYSGYSFLIKPNGTIVFDPPKPIPIKGTYNYSNGIIELTVKFMFEKNYLTFEKKEN